MDCKFCNRSLRRKIRNLRGASPSQAKFQKSQKIVSHEFECSAICFKLLKCPLCYMLGRMLITWLFFSVYVCIYDSTLCPELGLVWTQIQGDRQHQSYSIVESSEFGGNLHRSFVIVICPGARLVSHLLGPMWPWNSFDSASVSSVENWCAPTAANQTIIFLYIFRPVSTFSSGIPFSCKTIFYPALCPSWQIVFGAAGLTRRSGNH